MTDAEKYLRVWPPHELAALARVMRQKRIRARFRAMAEQDARREAITLTLMEAA